MVDFIMTNADTQYMNDSGTGTFTFREMHCELYNDNPESRFNGSTFDYWLSEMRNPAEFVDDIIIQASAIKFFWSLEVHKLTNSGIFFVLKFLPLPVVGSEIQ